MTHFSEHGFTLIELLIVILVLSSLMAMLVVGMGVIRQRSASRATQAMIDTIALDLARFPLKDRVLSSVGGFPRFRGNFNPDVDNFLDGKPHLDPGFSDSVRALARSVSYTGTVDSLGLSIKDRYVDHVTGRVHDGWNRPLRIAFHSTHFGSDGFGIWSVGADGIDQTGSGDFAEDSDDIRSWGSR